MRRKQSGLTAITWIIILGLVGTQAILALRIIPVYMNFNTVKSVMDRLTTDAEAYGKTPGEVRTLINRRLQINSMYELQKNKQAFKFKKLTDGLQIDLHYEERGPIYGNLEFVATFNHQVIIPKR